MLGAIVQPINAGLHATPTGTAKPAAPMGRSACREALAACLGIESARILRHESKSDAAWADVIRRTLDPGDRVVVLCNGYHSLCLAETARRAGLQVEIIEAEDGAEVPIGALAQRLGRDVGDDVRAILVMHAEASTGVATDIPAVRRAIDESFHEALLFVDGVATIGAVPFRMAEWDVDVAMCEWEGRMVAALQARALAVIGDAAVTLDEVSVSNSLQGAGRDATTARERVFAEWRRVAMGLRSGIAAMELAIVARHARSASDAVTAVRLPPTVCARDLIEVARRSFGVTIHPGMGEMAGSAIRILHAGITDLQACLAMLWALERALDELGAGVMPGAGVTAAWRSFGFDQQACSSGFHIAAE